jgi:uncharacterized protein
MELSAPQLVRTRVTHARKGGTVNAFSYGVEFALIPIRREVRAGGFWPLFSRNRFSMFAVLDRDHGIGAGDAGAWARSIARAHGLDEAIAGELWLLTQPRLFGFVFNPVSFWFMTDAAGCLRAVVAEVNNTFGERHAYYCGRLDQAPIGADDALHAEKVIAVSPFQRQAGGYEFHFDWRVDFVAVRIEFRDEEGGGLLATLAGARRPMRVQGLLAALLRGPFGSLRVVALIGWQALRLRLKGERFRQRRPQQVGEALR